MPEKLAQKVRAIIRDLEEFTIQDLVEPLHVQTYQEKARIKSAIKGLKKIGEVVSIRQGLFRYQLRNKPYSLLHKMWRAMRIKGMFTWRDIVILSGADRTHVHKYLVYLREQGFIELDSKDRSYEKGCYRMVAPDQAPLEHPHLPDWKRRKR